MSSQYQDIAQSFLYAQSVLIARGQELVKYAGECERSKDSSDPSVYLLALTGYRTGLSRLKDALDEYKSAFRDLSAYVKPK